MRRDEIFVASRRCILSKKNNENMINLKILEQVKYLACKVAFGKSKIFVEKYG